MALRGVFLCSLAPSFSIEEEYHVRDSWQRASAFFDRHIVEANLNVDDFEATKERDAPGTTKLIGTGKVTVIYMPTGIAHHYRDGAVPPPHV